ncbi:MAG: tetratricopeptide repeat protein [Saprospiraceae bacterium]|nr:tetratricopeptide repeat protein [Saprospiraceae bacterium]
MKYQFFIKISISIAFAITPYLIVAQSAHQYLRNGDKAYNDQDYSGAEDNYRRAKEKENKDKTLFNLGNSLYQQKRWEEATKYFYESANISKDADVKQKSYYNLGNAYFEQKKWDESIAAYKKSLQINPNDDQAKKNLSLALHQLKQQQSSSNDQHQNQQQQQNKNSQQQPKNAQQPQNNNNNNQSQTQPQNAGQPQPSQKNSISKEEAERLLKIVEDEEKRVQENSKKEKANPSKTLKDW